MTAPTSRSRAFFLELVLDIVIFALCAAVALQVFVQARVASDESTALTHLSLQAQQLAETFKATGADPAQTLYFDEKFVACEESSAKYYISCTVESSQEKLKTVQITATQHNATNNTDHELLSYKASYLAGREGGVR